jgi:hypothetical protein
MIKKMADFKHNGFSYELIIRGWKKGIAKYEAIKWRNGFPKLRERISYEDYKTIKSISNN